MSKFYEEQKNREEARARADRRKERLAQYLFDLSKLSFGGSVFAAVFAWINDISNYWYLVVLAVGMIATVVFAKLANSILK